ncbi:MAG: ribonuclease H-like domain-containing protein [Nitrospirales bacterium]|nr:ribonuclease H-like domain-containing protein [Nitrospirales bacterium]
MFRPHVMLESSFTFLKGIGDATERALWKDGLITWDQFLAHEALSRFSPYRKIQFDRELRLAQTRLEAGDASFFAQAFKTRDHWRLYDTYRDNTAYIDIETTGAPIPYGEITVVGIYGRGQMTTLIHGDTLSTSRLREELESYDLIVTFFGSGFDLPFLRAKFPGLALSQPHFDLCFTARRLGLKGGLKAIEKELDCPRSPELDGLNGLDAVRLWEEWQRGCEASGDLLIHYNQADTQNLEFVAETIYTRMVREYGPPSLHHTTA